MVTVLLLPVFDPADVADAPLLLWAGVESVLEVSESEGVDVAAAAEPPAMVTDATACPSSTQALSKPVMA